MARANLDAPYSKRLSIFEHDQHELNTLEFKELLLSSCLNATGTEDVAKFKHELLFALFF